jgi:hypothetical protein
MNVIEINTIEYLILNDYQLVYENEDFPVAILGGNKKSIITLEMIEEIKHISKSTWDAVSNI